MATGSNQNQIEKNLNSCIRDLTQTEIQDFANQVSVNGVERFCEYLSERASRWTNFPLRIAVTGSSGSGKSTLINTFRHVKPDEPHAAKTDVVECTFTVEAYSSPERPGLILYDLPGVGTPNFPRERYFELIREKSVDRIPFEAFDFFFIVAASRFTDNDAWLANKVQEGGKKFYFVRSKIDGDLWSDRKKNSKTHNEEDVLQRIRGDCSANLAKLGIAAHDRIFLVSGFLEDADNYDFPQMTKDLVDNCVTYKKDALLAAIIANCTHIIQQKAEQLRKNSFLDALQISVVSASPSAFTSVIYPSGPIADLYRKYKKMLGLDGSTLKTLADSHGKTVEELEEYLKNAGYGHYLHAHPPQLDTLKQAESLGKLFAKNLAERVPLAGPIIVSLTTFPIAIFYTLNMINEMEEAALRLFKYLSKKNDVPESAKAKTEVD